MPGTLPTMFDLLGSGFWHKPRVTGARSWRRIVMLAGLCLVGLPIQWFHRLCLALDHLFFPGFRRVAIHQPLFIVGPPRSGTTYLHRLIAADDRFTTFYLWELLLAPAICQKRFWLLIDWIDQKLGGYGERSLRQIERRLFGDLSTVHPTSLLDAEEDYFGLLPIACCFLLVVPFPDCESIWRLTRFDQDISERERRKVMAFYRGLLQRHLAVRGTQRHLVSKNPSFCGMVASLAEEFPDARFAVPIRTPLETLPSLLSSMQDGARQLDYDPKRLEPRFLQMMADYHSHLQECLDRFPERSTVVVYRELVASPHQTVNQVYRKLGFPQQCRSETMNEERSPSRTWKSRHRYSLEDFGLDVEQIVAQYRWLFDDPRFGLTPPKASIDPPQTVVGSHDRSDCESSEIGERSCC